MKTWEIEIVFVFAVLFFSTILFHAGSGSEWVGALAVLLNFAHVQISDRLAEREASKETPEVECHWKIWWYFVAKEAAWTIYFLMSHCYSALIGVGLFLLYPLWRMQYRKRFPLGRKRTANGT